MVQWLVERLIVSSNSESVCWFSWLILAVWPFMVFVGTLTQCCITGTGTYHTQCKLRTLTQCCITGTGTYHT